jgi:NAD(P)H-hydrate epimerase
MKSVLSVQEMKHMDVLTMKSLKLSEIDLMQQAGEILTQDFLLRVQPQKHDFITIVAGVGNNGGDGLVMALTLLKNGFKPKVIIVGQMDGASSSFRHFFNQLKEHIKVVILSKETKNDVQKTLLSSVFIIDAMFGIGLRRPLEGAYLDMVHDINDYQKKVYSVDIPTGIDPNNGIILPEAIQANYTGVVGYLKYGNLFNDALDYHGDIEVLDIGLVKKHQTEVNEIEDEDFSLLEKKRKHHSHKYDYGLGYFIGGSKTMSGAINLSVLAAMRSGLGISQVYQEKPLTKHVEVLYKDINDCHDFNKVNTVVFGPGLKTGEEKYKALYNQINQLNIPSVIDGGGLSYVNLNDIQNHQMVFTPHMKEFSDLMNVSIEAIIKDPIHYVKTFVETGVTLVLKGETTVIANKNHIYLYQAKNPGLATAGSGDVLSGIIARYLVDFDPFMASVKAVMLHAKASRLARDIYGETSMMASDIILQIHNVLKRGSYEI